MAGRVLRSSNGRFAGSTKGWGKGRKGKGRSKVSGKREVHILPGGILAVSGPNGPGRRSDAKQIARGKRNVATHTAKRAAKTATRRVAINSAKTVAKYAAGTAGAAVLGSVVQARALKLDRRTTYLIAKANGKRGLVGGAMVGAAVAAVRAPGTFRASASASATTGLSNRAAAKIRKANPKLTKSQSYKLVYKGNSKARKVGKILKGRSSR